MLHDNIMTYRLIRTGKVNWERWKEKLVLTEANDGQLKGSIPFRFGNFELLFSKRVTMKILT